jgi:hypothetical protein
MVDRTRGEQWRSVWGSILPQDLGKHKPAPEGKVERGTRLGIKGEERGASGGRGMIARRIRLQSFDLYPSWWYTVIV